MFVNYAFLKFKGKWRIMEQCCTTLNRYVRKYVLLVYIRMHIRMYVSYAYTGLTCCTTRSSRADKIGMT